MGVGVNHSPALGWFLYGNYRGLLLLQWKALGSTRQELWGIVAAHRESQSERTESMCWEKHREDRRLSALQALLPEAWGQPYPFLSQSWVILAKKSLVVKLGRVGFLSLAIKACLNYSICCSPSPVHLIREMVLDFIKNYTMNVTIIL